MLRRLFKKKSDQLDEAIERVMLAMSHVDEDSEEYANLLGHLQKLSEVRTKIRSKPLSMDALVAAIASIVTVLFMVGYEHGHVIGSKAIGLIPKPGRS
jgi:hypothetical protein